MSYTCDCGWTFVGDTTQEELLARIDHLRKHHTPDHEREFEDTNLELIRAVHDALHAIECEDLGGWYSSQVDRMRGDACEILGWETDDHERTAVAIDHEVDE